MLSENRFPYFVSCNNYGEFTVRIIDDINKTNKTYIFKNTDSAFHERWKKGLSHPNPKIKWKTLKQIEVSGTLQPVIQQEQFTFRDFIELDSCRSL